MNSFHRRAEDLTVLHLNIPNHDRCSCVCVLVTNRSGNDKKASKMLKHILNGNAISTLHPIPK